MLTLAIETSTPHGSVAVHDGERLIVEESFVADRSHSSTLFPLLQRVLGTVPRPARLAVGLGPGSYAGVRIAIAAAMGLQMALGAELVGIPSVAALNVTASIFAAIGDARRDTYYWTHIESGACRDGPRLLSASELQTQIAESELPLFASEPIPIAPGANLAHPSASVLAQLAAQNRGITARGELEPIYLREPHITQPKKSILP